MESETRPTISHFAVVLFSALSIVLGVVAYLQYQKSEKLNNDLQTADEALKRTAIELQTAHHELTQLQATNRELQAAVETLETTIRELEATNQELISTNRELQASKSESEPSRQELVEDIDALKALLMLKPLETVGRIDSPPTTIIGFVNQEQRRLGGPNAQKTVISTIAKMREHIDNLQRENRALERSNIKWITDYRNLETKYKNLSDQNDTLRKDLKKQRE